MRPRRLSGTAGRPLSFTVRRPMSTAAPARAIWFVATMCAGVASAESMLDPALVDEAAKLEPGQSIVRGNSKVTLHQRAAGIKDESGWFTAKSENGGFSVRLPTPINDETYYTRDDDGSQIEANI